MLIPTHKLVNIRYTKLGTRSYDDGDPATVEHEVDNRTIIPTFMPHRNNFKAVDVSELSEEGRAEMLALLTEYHEYYNERAKSIFNFEDWIEHTRDEKLNVKWRTFKLDQTEVLD